MSDCLVGLQKLSRCSWGAADFTPTFSLTCVMGWACGHSDESPLSPSQGQFLLSLHQSGSQCVRCFIQHSGVYFWHLAASAERKEEGDGCVAALQYRVAIASCFKPAGPLQAYIKQPEHLFPHFSLLRWKDEDVFDQREIEPRSKTRLFYLFIGATERFWADECFEHLCETWVYSRVKQLDFWC